MFSYNGNDIKNIKFLHDDQLRLAILTKKEELLKKFGSDSDIVLLIKPTNDASYKDVINALNEMLICNIKTYVLMDATNDELQAIKKGN